MKSHSFIIICTVALIFELILGIVINGLNFDFCFEVDKMVNVAVDIMGGDNAPTEPVKGAINAITSQDGIKVFLCGKKEVIEQELRKYQYPSERVEIVDAQEVIDTGEPPVMAIRKKKDSSIVKGLNLVKHVPLSITIHEAIPVEGNREELMQKVYDVIHETVLAIQRAAQAGILSFGDNADRRDRDLLHLSVPVAAVQQDTRLYYRTDRVYSCVYEPREHRRIAPWREAVG